MARSPTEPLDLRRARRRIDGLGNQRVVHIGAESVADRDPLAIHLRRRRWKSHHPLPHPHLDPRGPPHPHPRRHPAGLLRALRPMGDNAHRDRHPTVRRRQCQRQLQQFRHGPGVPWRVDRDSGLADTGQYLLVLESLVCLVHHPCCLVPVDDDSVVAGPELRLTRQVARRMKQGKRECG